MAAEAQLQAQRDLIDKLNELAIPLLDYLALPLGTMASSFHLPTGQAWAKLQRTTEDVCLHPFSVAPPRLPCQSLLFSYQTAAARSNPSAPFH